MRAEAAGEQAVAIGDVHDVAGPGAGGAHRARHHVGPDVDIVLRYSRPPSACRWCRRRHGCGTTFSRGTANMPNGIVVAQVGLVGEREFRKVGERLQVVGMHAGRVEAACGNAARCRRHGASDHFRRCKLQAPRSRRARRSRSDRGLLAGRGAGLSWRCSSPSVLEMLPLMVREWPRNSAITVPSCVGDGHVVDAGAPGPARPRAPCAVSRSPSLARRDEGDRRCAAPRSIWLWLLQAKAKALSASVKMTPPWQMPWPLQ